MAIVIATAGLSLPQTAAAQEIFSPAPESPALNLGSFNIVINAGTGLSENAAALAAFNRAADKWEAYFSDPITVTIDADLGALGAGILGSTGSVQLQGSYNILRNQLVADAGDEADDLIVTFLPTAAQFTATLAPGASLTGNLVATKANLKAIGFTGLDSSFGVSDGSITFSNSFAFDFDNSDGIGAGQIDFESVAVHEIGHALGFISAVDTADAGDTSIQPTLLDLFRFQNGSANDPSNAAGFTTASRDLVPGHEAIFDDTANEVLMSTGVANGDGQQASHLKDNLGLGIMDPTLAKGEVSQITDNDLRVFDLIGWDYTPVVPVPEPSAALLISLGVFFGLSRRRR